MLAPGVGGMHACPWTHNVWMLALLDDASLSQIRICQELQL